MSDPSTHRILHRLFAGYLRPYVGLLIGAVLCMVVAAGTTAANAWMMQPVLDEIFLKHNDAMLRIIPLAVLGIGIASALASYGQAYLLRVVGQGVLARMQTELFAHLLQADLASFHDKGSGHLIARFTHDIQAMRLAVSNALTAFAKETLSLVFLVGVMVYQSLELALIASIVFPVAVLPVMRLGRRMRKLAGQAQRELGELASSLDETFQGVRIVKAYGRETFEAERAGSIIARLHGYYLKSARIQTASSPLMEAFTGVAIAAVIWYGGSQVLSGATTPGAFFSFVTAMIMAYRPLKVLAGLHTNVQEGIAAASRYFEALDTKARVHDAANAKPLEIAEGEVRFENISFAYAPGAGGVKDVSLVLPPGKTVALVGPSGGGKTTLMNLLMRFYDVGDGRITIDGQDIRGVTLASLRGAMALVSQETVLFDDTVRANIRYGRLEAGDAEVEEAARAAAADAFIRALPQGYDTKIGPHGVKLSGGQRQRLAIARALLKNAPVLLLDEATSALDTESEQQVQAALKRLMKGRTTLVIAHRLSTIAEAEKICVVADGTVAETGSHAELMQADGLYRQLYARQQHMADPALP